MILSGRINIAFLIFLIIKLMESLTWMKIWIDRLVFFLFQNWIQCVNFASFYIETMCNKNKNRKREREREIGKCESCFHVLGLDDCISEGHLEEHDLRSNVSDGFSSNVLRLRYQAFRVIRIKVAFLSRRYLKRSLSRGRSPLRKSIQYFIKLISRRFPDFLIFHSI